MSAALCIQLSLEFRIGPPSFNGLAPSTWSPLGRYTIHPLSRLEPTGLAGHLDCTTPCGVEHHSWSFAEDRCGSHRPYIGPSRTSALQLPRLATRSAAQDFQHIPVFETPFAAGSRLPPPAPRATRRSRCPEQPCSASLSAGFHRWTDLCSAAYSVVTYATILSAATYLPAS